VSVLDASVSLPREAAPVLALGPATGTRATITQQREMIIQSYRTDCYAVDNLYLAALFRQRTSAAPTGQAAQPMNTPRRKAAVGGR